MIQVALCGLYWGPSMLGNYQIVRHEEGQCCLGCSAIVHSNTRLLRQPAKRRKTRNVSRQISLTFLKAETAHLTP